VNPSQRPRILRAVFILLGLVLVGLSFLLPFLMETVIQHRGAGGAFLPGYLRSLTPFISDAAMASAFVATAVILSFERSEPTGRSVLFGVLTLSVFAAEISLSLYLSLLNPAPRVAPSVLGIYVLIGLVPFGLACTMFTLASFVSAKA